MREQIRRLSPKSKVAKPIRYMPVALGFLYALPRRRKSLLVEQRRRAGSALRAVGAATGPSRAPTKGAVAQQRSTLWFKPAASTTSIRAPGSPTSLRGCLIIPSSASAN
jgi:hypothetical protein